VNIEVYKMHITLIDVHLQRAVIQNAVCVTFFERCLILKVREIFNINYTYEPCATLKFNMLYLVYIFSNPGFIPACDLVKNWMAVIKIY